VANPLALSGWSGTISTHWALLRPTRIGGLARARAWLTPANPIPTAAVIASACATTFIIRQHVARAGASSHAALWGKTSFWQIVP
jgi:hypothetical protein